MLSLFQKIVSLMRHMRYFSRGPLISSLQMFFNLFLIIKRLFGIITSGEDEPRHQEIIWILPPPLLPPPLLHPRLHPWNGARDSCVGDGQTGGWKDATEESVIGADLSLRGARSQLSVKGSSNVVSATFNTSIQIM